jgi:hypothetical protein
MYVVRRPPGDFPPRKVRVLIDILLEYYGRQVDGLANASSAFEESSAGD